MHNRVLDWFQVILSGRDVSDKVLKFNKATGIINKAMKPSLVQRHIHICLYKIFSRPILSYYLFNDKKYVKKKDWLLTVDIAGEYR